MNDFNQIIEKYPLLFDGISPQEPFALFGFECDIGWFNIIKNACHVMYRDYAQSKRQYDYAQNSLNHFDQYLLNRRTYDKKTSEQEMLKELEAWRDNHESAMNEAIKQMPKIAQIKEKFGTLRIYVDNFSEKYSTVIDYAEQMSEVTCEECGNAGKTYEMDWFKTLCKEHAIKRYGQDKIQKYENNED